MLTLHNHSLCSSRKIILGGPCTEAFTALKKALAAALVLAMPDFSQPFIAESDASGYGLGADYCAVARGASHCVL